MGSSMPIEHTKKTILTFFIWRFVCSFPKRPTVFLTDESVFVVWSLPLHWVCEISELGFASTSKEAIICAAILEWSIHIFLVSKKKLSCYSWMDSILLLTSFIGSWLGFRLWDSELFFCFNWLKLDLFFLDGTGCSGDRVRENFVEFVFEKAFEWFRFGGEGINFVFDGKPWAITKIMVFNFEHYIMRSKSL